MEAVAKAILAAREEILIACWLISPEVKLVRPYDDDDGSMRLVSLLNKRAKIEELQSTACEWKSSTRNGQQRAEEELRRDVDDLKRMQQEHISKSDTNPLASPFDDLDEEHVA
ncbi:unnamed protein product [Rotaria magnacalcarata]